MGKWGNVDLKQLKALEQRMAQMEEADLDTMFRQVSNELAQILLNKVKKRTPVGVKPDFKNDLGEDLPKHAKVVGASGKSKSFLTKEGAILEQYWSGYVGGTLRDSWRVEVTGHGANRYITVVLNPMEYASYVEYGHRQRPGRYVPQLGKRLKANWVKGKFMMSISAQELENLAPQKLEKAIYQALKEVF